MNFSKHCDLCENEMTSFEKGLTCKLTKKKPEFENTCSEIKLDEKFLEKLEIAKQLERFGVDRMEAGFPASSTGDFESVKMIADTIKNSSVIALARSVKSDIDISWEALKNAAEPAIHVFLATSPIHRKYKLSKEPEEVIELAVSMVKYAPYFIFLFCTN